jgi:hypothetical protein
MQYEEENDEIKEFNDLIIVWSRNPILSPIESPKNTSVEKLIESPNNNKQTSSKFDGKIVSKKSVNESSDDHEKALS